MKKIKLLLINISLLSLAIQGCGNAGSKSKKTYPTTIGTAVSMTAEDEEKYTLTREISKIAETDINTINRQEATNFSKTVSYCDTSGLKEEELSGSLERIQLDSSYQLCKDEYTMQNGDTVMTYENIDEDGKFPTKLQIAAKEDYIFNNITLKDGATIACKDIRYNSDKTLDSMMIIINGKVEYNNKIYTLENHKELINF